MPIIFPVISVHAMPLKPFNPIFRVCWCKVVFVWHCFDMVLVLFLFLFLFLFAIFSTKEKKKIKVQEFKSLRVRVKEKLCEHRFEHSNNTRSLSLSLIHSLTHLLTRWLTHSPGLFGNLYLWECAVDLFGALSGAKDGRVDEWASKHLYESTHIRIYASAFVHVLYIREESNVATWNSVGSPPVDRCVPFFSMKPYSRNDRIGSRLFISFFVKFEPLKKLLYKPRKKNQKQPLPGP